MGLFDDLMPSQTPQGPNTPKPPPSVQGAGLFDDLMPQASPATSFHTQGEQPSPEPTPAPAPAPIQTPAMQPVSTMFNDLLPRELSPKTTQQTADVLDGTAKTTGLETMGNDLARSGMAVKGGLQASLFMLGLSDDYDGLAEAMTQLDAADAAFPKSKERLELDRQIKAIPDDNSWRAIGDTIATYLTNPRGSLSASLESLATFAGPLAGGAAGAAAGSLAGPIGTGVGLYGGVAAGSGLMDYGASWREYIQEKAKPQNVAEWKAALQNKDLVNEAHWYAAKHSGAVAAFDMIGMKASGKFAARYFVPNTSLGKKVVGVAGGTAIDMATEGAGEAAGQLWGKGTVDMKDVIAETLLGGPQSVVTTTIEPIREYWKDRQSQAAPLTPDTKVEPPFSEAPTQITVNPKRIEGQAASQGIGAQEAPPFYSQVRRAVEEKGPTSADPQQWLATIRNSPGVKQEELDETGLEDFIASQQGKVTKADILAHLEENEVKVEEVVKQAQPPLPGIAGWTNPSQPGDVQYAEYQTPGPSTGYRELLLTLPSRATTPIRPDRHPMEQRQAREREGDFFGGHWNEPNVLAHVRFAERQDATGAPILHVQEIQSDWHQTGRKQGYQGSMPPIPKAVSARQTRSGPGQFDNVWEVTLDNGQTLSTSGVRNEREAISQANYRVENKAPVGVPDAPFKSSWSDLAIKRMLRWAADNGYSRMSLPTAEHQIALYPGLTSEQKAGMKEFYDKVLPSRVKYWAKKVGGRTSMTPVRTDTALLIPAQAAPGRWGIRESVDPASPVYPLYEDSELTGPRNTYYANSEQEALNWLTEQGGSTGLDNLLTVEIPATAASFIKKGLPLFNAAPGTNITVHTDPTLSGDTDRTKQLNVESRKAVVALKELMNRFGIKARVRIFVGPSPIGAPTDLVGGVVTKYADGSYTINVDPAMNETPMGVWGSLTHEMGHILMWELYAKAPQAVKTKIVGAYNKWRMENVRADAPFNKVMQSKWNYSHFMFNKQGMRISDIPFGSLAPEKHRYHSGFDEWFAEQVARWAVTDEVPITVVEKYIAGISKKLLELLKTVSVKLGMSPASFAPDVAVAEWLNSYHQKEITLTPEINEAHARETQEQNQRAVERDSPEVRMPPHQPASQPGRDGIDGVFRGAPPPEAADLPAWGDKFNKLYEWGLSVIQVAKRNLHIQELQRYVEQMQRMHRDEHAIQDAALRVSKMWRGLGQRQADAVTHLLDEVMNLTYLTPQERQQGVKRWPTPQELQDIATRHRVSPEGMRVYNRVKSMFTGFINAIELLAMEDAMKLVDPVARAGAVSSTRTRFANLKAAPYFPAMRFGNYTITVRDARGEVVYFETTEAKRFSVPRLLKKPKASQLQRAEEIERNLAPGETIHLGYLEKDVRPLVGMPAALVEAMSERLNLSTTQRDALDQLKYEYAPAQSFRHRFQHRKGTPGYSDNFQRAFAHYFFHGSKFYARVKYVQGLRSLIKLMRQSANFMPDSTKRKQISNFLSEHLDETLDPKKDWAALRSMMFTWALGFSPAAATLNLTQILVGTYPFLSSKFGDLATIREMGKAGKNVENFYRRGSYQGATEFHLRALDMGIKQGVITEAMAPELAAITDGRNLGQGFGGNAAQQGLNKVAEMGSFMFEMMEQVNRRITFRAALELAQQQPTNPHINSIIEQNRVQHQDLLNKGWTDAEARAYLVAQDAVQTTQYVYAKWARPKFMRGRLGTVFIFKTFVQNTLFFLWNYPGAMVRSLLIMAFIGGFMGLPGGEDLREIIRAIAYQLYGKDFDIEKEARKYILDIANENIPPDILLHGMARRGFGIPAIADLLGNTVGYGSLDTTKFRFKFGHTPDPKSEQDVKNFGRVPTAQDLSGFRAPQFDRSGAVGMGRILPVELGKLFGPTKDQSRVISDQVQNAAGVAFGVGFNIYKALTDSQLEADDPKRWERAVPRAMASASKAWRAFDEGRERNRSGATVVNYDVRDPEQMMEVLAMGMGYQNIRQSAQWNRIIAEREVISFWDLKRQGLLKQYFNAMDDPKELELVKGAIRKFNDELPESVRPKAISADTVRRSVQTRQRQINAQESGVDVIRSNRLLQQEIQRLYPEAVVDVRKVR